MKVNIQLQKSKM